MFKKVLEIRRKDWSLALSILKQTAEIGTQGSCSSPFRYIHAIVPLNIHNYQLLAVVLLSD